MLTKTDLVAIDSIIIKRIKEALVPVTKTLNQVVKNQKMTDNFLDEENLKTVARVKRIEDHLGI